MEFETNDYVMCMICQSTHHEGDQHECDNLLVPDALDEIKQEPGIDTPLLCLRLHSADMVDPGTRNHELAKWLMEWHRGAWERTCDAVDQLLDEGEISFSDDGELRATGY